MMSPVRPGRAGFAGAMAFLFDRAGVCLYSIGAPGAGCPLQKKSGKSRKWVDGRRPRAGPGGDFLVPLINSAVRPARSRVRGLDLREVL